MAIHAGRRSRSITATWPTSILSSQHHTQRSPGSINRATRWPVAPKCLRACLVGRLSPKPTSPHTMHTRRRTHSRRLPSRTRRTRMHRPSGLRPLPCARRRPSGARTMTAFARSGAEPAHRCSLSCRVDRRSHDVRRTRRRSAPHGSPPEGAPLGWSRYPPARAGPPCRPLAPAPS